jgi:hypothetical protein
VNICSRVVTVRSFAGVAMRSVSVQQHTLST